ncbi:G-type lectin S-receptor-like serine/threonine-protein kinase LECRK1 isoform X2 [Ziziphus jujuba]|uniref:G-type lectin S-receptor-like serine/threonine-protein kinase LECRK1 isoform X2 n=1 Tax=Ziziphus jujuba TaxID=326968 RepID=A0ABM4ADC4_ZIZJJ|nr:G-type lectin S-receptor-like serine/threonine-protein kinase LECRK1 isoform X2 [Ziziphus jujuba]
MVRRKLLLTQHTLLPLLPCSTLMQLDGNLVLYPINTDNSSIDAYWSSETFGNGFKYHLYLNHTGLLAIVNTTSSEMVRSLSLGGGGSSSSENGQKVEIYRATIDSDGIFRLYYHGVDDKNNGKAKNAVMVWKALNNPCEVQGFCGINSFCAIFDDQPNCLCIPGSDFVDLNQKTLGCLRNYSDEGCVYGRENTTFYSMEKMENIMWGDIAYMEASMSMEECENSCLEDCNRGAALFKQDEEDYESDLCLKQKLPLRYLRRDFDNSITTTAFIKVGKKDETTTINGTNSVPTVLVPPGRTQQVITSKIVLIQILVLVIAFVIFSFVSLAISGLYIFKIRILRYKRLGEINGQMGCSGDDELIALRVFSYNELKKATDGFKEELGKGSFGAVYKGVLNRGRKLVAVKRLEKLIEEGEREFRAEMRAISRTNHKNLVRLMGYCAEDSKRLLVYEYMSNGSLADLLFKQAKRPDWNSRVRIAIDVAKGINYLHEQCRTPIIHCDVKPQNILMDDFWNAKISDFGLAKLLMPDQTRTFTGIRGTRGYLAPEWEKNTPISVKADVYSYGIVLLEIICCRRNLEMNVPTIDEIVLSCWIYKCFASRQLYKRGVGEDADKETLEKMVKVGLWCIQDEPVLRPSMKSVVLMLEGITDIASPPCPTSSSI